MAYEIRDGKVIDLDAPVIPAATPIIPQVKPETVTKPATVEPTPVEKTGV